MNNIQTFSQGSDQYAKHRPQYPEDLFSYLNEICNRHDSAWDCATGNGQAAVSLAKYFSHVEATDISTEQIQHSIVHPKVHYSICHAEHTPFDAQSFDLITVATAVHWFDQQRFFQEVECVLRPNGVLAIWTYGSFEIEREIDSVIAKELLDPVDRFWAGGKQPRYCSFNITVQENFDNRSNSVQVGDINILLLFVIDKEEPTIHNVE